MLWFRGGSDLDFHMLYCETEEMKSTVMNVLTLLVWIMTLTTFTTSNTEKIYKWHSCCCWWRQISRHSLDTTDLSLQDLTWDLGSDLPCLNFMLIQIFFFSLFIYLQTSGEHLNHIIFLIWKYNFLYNNNNNIIVFIKIILINISISILVNIY